MKLPKRHDDAEARREQALTPMIDLVFLLLTFWICASVGRVSEQVLATELSGTAIELAAPTDEPPPPLGELWVRLDRAGNLTTVTVNDRTYPGLEALEEAFQGLAAADAAGELPVILDVGGAVPAGDVVRVYDAARAAGFEQVSFAADAPQAGN
ncbi:ExbD/TolR family protein [Alienimonas californiensis]|uniref:Biopolymer transport protein ExbD/TolR n=1 Tax=Alienimonas californiensis TaxID=2527989 RepID=A0A517P9Y0_9PLAN|nr:biopolymer transporter ExbD [Alienimonas californiensis]QDT16181.1 Biopolymer transport protein ExbD/TolR [Alienimonas californiensis]